MAKKEIPITCEAAEIVPVDSLEYFQGNLKTLDADRFEKLKAAILKYGFTAPVFAWRGNIIDGHQRIFVIRKMLEDGYTIAGIPIAHIHAKTRKEAAEKLLSITSQFAKITEEGLADFVVQFDLDLEELGNTIELSGIDLSPEEPEPGLTDPDEIPEPPEDPVTATGDLWLLGDHRVLCGDSADAVSWATVTAGERYSLVFADPPYGVAIGAKNRMLNSFQPSGRNLTDIVDDSASPDELKAKLLPVFTNCREYAAADCSFFVTAPQGGDLGMMMMMMKESGLTVRHVLIWKKNSPTFSMGRLDYDYQHEPILLTWGKKHKRPMRGEHRTSVWEIDKPKASPDHPTMKPVELVVNALLNNSEGNDSVADPFLGSGTTLIAAEQLKRRCFGIEISPAYVDVIVKRWQEFTGKEAVHEKTGKTFNAMAMAKTKRKR